MEAKNLQFFKNIGKTAVVEKNKMFATSMFRNSNWKFWLIYTFFNYGTTWNILFGTFYPRHKLLVHYFYLCQKTRTSYLIHSMYKVFWSEENFPESRDATDYFQSDIR